MRSISHKLYGIVNGIDYDIYNPQTDKLVYNNYSPDNLTNKTKNKAMLQILLRLKQDPAIPMLALVTRLVNEKGLDLLSHILHELMQENVQLVVLGTGDRHYEKMFKTFESYYPDKFSANIYFDNSLSHKIYSGADIFLMPSKIEPCGIGQMIAMRYGTLPIARKVGGLKDTVDPFNKYTNEGTGFCFVNYNAHEFLFTIKDSLDIYNNKRATWDILIKNAMEKDLSWINSAYRYMELYKNLLK
jgi:starch synthase